MKKVFTVVVGIFLSGFLITLVSAEPNDETGTRPKEETKTTTEKANLSKRNKAKLEQAEQAKIRRDKIVSLTSNTMAK